MEMTVQELASRERAAITAADTATAAKPQSEFKQSVVATEVKFSNLPNDVMLMIANYLGDDELLRLSQLATDAIKKLPKRSHSNYSDTMSFIIMVRRLVTIVTSQFIDKSASHKHNYLDMFGKTYEQFRRQKETEFWSSIHDLLDTVYAELSQQSQGSEVKEILKLLADLQARDHERYSRVSALSSSPISDLRNPAANNLDYKIKSMLLVAGCLCMFGILSGTISAIVLTHELGVGDIVGLTFLTLVVTCLALCFCLKMKKILINDSQFFGGAHNYLATDLSQIEPEHKKQWQKISTKYLSDIQVMNKSVNTVADMVEVLTALVTAHGEPAMTAGLLQELNQLRESLLSLVQIDKKTGAHDYTWSVSPDPAARRDQGLVIAQQLLALTKDLTQVLGNSDRLSQRCKRLESATNLQSYPGGFFSAASTSSSLAAEQSDKAVEHAEGSFDDPNNNNLNPKAFGHPE